MRVLKATSRRLKARVLIVYALTIHFFEELNCFASRWEYKSISLVQHFSRFTSYCLHGSLLFYF